jgi:hypothetical protein
MIRSKRITLDTPNLGVMLDILEYAYNSASKPKKLKDITEIEPWFSEGWGGIRFLNKETGGEHFWIGIWWDKPCLLRFEFVPGLYNKNKIPSAKDPQEYDWWPYLEFELSQDL